MSILTRREFVRVTTASLATLGARRPASVARIRFGYAAITWSGNDRQAIEDIEAVGFPGIQLRSGILPEYQSRPADLRALLGRHHLTFVALSSGNVSVDPSLRSKTIAEHVDHARFTRDAGGLHLQLIDEKPRGRAVTNDDIARLGDLLSEIGRQAADLGVRAVYHPHMGTIGETPEAADRVLAAADARSVKLLLDVAHYQQGGGDPVAAIRRYRDRLAMLHLKDVETTAPGSYRFVELGRGRVDLTGVLKGLVDVGFDGWAVVELDRVVDAGRTPKEAAANSKQYLARLGFNIAAPP
jgi:inosose dehydratase